MALTEKVTFLLSVNAKGVAKEFDKVGREADRSLGKAEERSEKLSATFTKVGAGMVAAGALAGAALYGMAQDAASMAETVDKATILFGDGLDRVIEFSDGAAKSLGIAKDQALDAASTFAIYGKRAGLAGDDLAGFSTELVQIAGDMASFNDASIADTIEAIGSGLRGESEPLQKFGVDTRVAALEAAALEAGLIGVGEKLTEAMKPMAVMAAIQQQASDQMGNFALTSDSAANQAKQMAAEVQNLRLELGEAALPVLREVLTALNSMVGAFNSLPGPIKSVVSQTALWGSALLVMGGAVLMIIGRVKTLTNTLGSLNSIKLGAAGIALTELAMVVNAFMADAEENQRRVGSMADSIAELGEVDGMVARFEEIGASSDRLRNLLKNLDEGGFQAVAEAMAAGASDGGIVDMLKDFGLNGQQAVMVMQRFREEYDGAMDEIDKRDALEKAALASNRAGEEIRMLGNRATATAPAVEELGGSINRMEPPALTLAEAIEEVNEGLDRLFGSIQGAEELEASFQETLDGVTKSIEENGAAIGTQTEGQRANLDARGDVIQAINDTVAAMVEEGASSDAIVAKAQSMVDAYGETALAATGSEEKARDLTAALDDIPEDVATELELSGYDEAYWEAENLRKMLESMDRVYAATVNVNSSGGGGGGGTTSTEEQGLPDDWTPGGRSAQKPRMARSFDMGDGGGKSPTINLTNVIEIDGREMARALQRVSERDGGLRLKLRAGG